MMGRLSAIVFDGNPHARMPPSLDFCIDIPVHSFEYHGTMQGILGGYYPALAQRIEGDAKEIYRSAGGRRGQSVTLPTLSFRLLERRHFVNIKHVAGSKFFPKVRV
jgi:hypothetical protein